MAWFVCIHATYRQHDCGTHPKQFMQDLYTRAVKSVVAGNALPDETKDATCDIDSHDDYDSSHFTILQLPAVIYLT